MLKVWMTYPPEGQLFWRSGETNLLVLVCLSVSLLRKNRRFSIQTRIRFNSGKNVFGQIWWSKKSCMDHLGSLHVHGVMNARGANHTQDLCPTWNWDEHQVQLHWSTHIRLFKLHSGSLGVSLTNSIDALKYTNFYWLAASEINHQNRDLLHDFKSMYRIWNFKSRRNVLNT